MSELTIAQRFYLNDYMAASELLKNYSNMRITAVGISLALYGALIAAPTQNTLFELILSAISMTLIITCCVRMIGTLNANVYARCLHLEWVEKQLQAIGFFSYWNTYAPNNAKDAASNAYKLACYILNFGMLSYVCVSAFKVFIIVKSKSNLVSVCTYNLQLIMLTLVMISLLAIFVFNHQYIARVMNTSKLIEGLRNRLNAQRDIALQKFNQPKS